MKVIVTFEIDCRNALGALVVVRRLLRTLTLPTNARIDGVKLDERGLPVRIGDTATVSKRIDVF